MDHFFNGSVHAMGPWNDLKMTQNQVFMEKSLTKTAFAFHDFSWWVLIIWLSSLTIFREKMDSFEMKFNMIWSLRMTKKWPKQPFHAMCICYSQNYHSFILLFGHYYNLQFSDWLQAEVAHFLLGQGMLWAKDMIRKWSKYSYFLKRITFVNCSGIQRHLKMGPDCNAELSKLFS